MQNVPQEAFDIFTVDRHYYNGNVLARSTVSLFDQKVSPLKKVLHSELTEHENRLKSVLIYNVLTRFYRQRRYAYRAVLNTLHVKNVGFQKLSNRIKLLDTLSRHLNHVSKQHFHKLLNHIFIYQDDITACFRVGPADDLHLQISKIIKYSVQWKNSTSDQ